MSADGKRYQAAVKRRLADLGRMGAEVDAVERKIHGHAADRLEAVQADIKKLRPRVLLDDKAAERYRALIDERAKLQRIIAGASAQVKA